MIRAIANHFDLSPASRFPELKDDGLIASVRILSGHIPIFNFVPPTGGMFIWSKFYLSDNLRFREFQRNTVIEDPEQEFAKELWLQLAENLVSFSHFYFSLSLFNIPLVIVRLIM